MLSIPQCNTSKILAVENTYRNFEAIRMREYQDVVSLCWLQY